ncbi:MAG: nodulation protein NfeD [Elusimicrobiota bacterium]|jgi:membrane-bound serine protease (ClpP class)
MKNNILIIASLGWLMQSVAFAGATVTGPVHNAPAKTAPPKALVATFSGVISPVASEYLVEAVAEAERRGSDLLVIELDTPGGLDLSMRGIVKGIFAARVPVVVYVQPSGGRAASAGVFITMAAHVAAMAPGTNIGAAHPVMIGGGGGGLPGGKKEEADKTMETKVASDASAYIKSIAHRRGRNETWAFEAVTKSTSIASSEAVAMKVVDLEAPSLEDLLKAIDGRKLADFERPLRSAGAELERWPMTRRQRWLAALSDPNVAMILMSLGAGGLFIELYHPGLILPGVVGAVSLILAFYSFETLSASYAGVLLILAGFVFFLLEIKVTSYGMLALGGVAATLLGVLMLFRHHALGGLGVSWDVLGGTLGGLLGLVAFLSWIVMRAYRRPVATGSEALVGAEGHAAGALAPAGKVAIGGELWDARSESGEIPDGAAVVVSSVVGLHLTVRRK